MMQLVHWARRAPSSRKWYRSRRLQRDIPTLLALLRDAGALTIEKFATSTAALITRL
jgi:hypothetical protein